MVALVVLLGFASVAGLFVYLTILDARKWPAKMAAILIPIGFKAGASEEEKARLAQHLLIVNPQHQGRRLLKHWYRRESPGGDFVVFVCDCYFSSASGKARGGNRVLICLLSSALNLPHFSIASTPADSGHAAKLFAALSEAFEKPGMHRILTGAEDLDRRFHVFVESSHSDMPIPAELLTGSGLAAGAAELDAKADILILSSAAMMADRVRQVLDPQKLQGLILVATRLYAALKH